MRERVGESEAAAKKFSGPQTRFCILRERSIKRERAQPAKNWKIKGNIHPKLILRSSSGFKRNFAYTERETQTSEWSTVHSDTHTACIQGGETGVHQTPVHTRPRNRRAFFPLKRKEKDETEKSFLMSPLAMLLLALP